MKNLLTVSLLLISPLFILAQTVSGLWYGTLVNDSTHKKQNYELGLSEYRGKITGYTYTTFIENDTFYYSIKKIRAERKDGTLVIEDVEMVGNNFPEKAAKRVRQTTVFPLINDSTLDMANGRWSTNQTKVYYSLSGAVDMQEQKEDKRSAMLSHLQEMNVKNNITSKKPEKKDEGMAVNNNKAIYQKNEPVATVNKSAQNNKTTQEKTVKPEIKKEENKNGIVKNESVSTTGNKQPVVDMGQTDTRTAAISQPQDQKKIEEKKPDPVTEEVNNTRPQKNTTSVTVAMPTSQLKNTAVQKTNSLPDMVAQRTAAVLEPIYFKNDSLILALYDNGVVDGDTVTVYLNGETILLKQKLKEAATKKTIHITPGTDSLQLVLFADNLGSIPPNTGLLTIRDGDELYQVRFSADLKQNAAITLKRRRN